MFSWLRKNLPEAIFSIVGNGYTVEHVSSNHNLNTADNPNTCHKDHKIYNGPTGKHISVCRDLCNSNRKCKYFLYNSRSKCILFDGCKTVRQTYGNGTKITYKKDQGKVEMLANILLFFHSIPEECSVLNKHHEVFYNTSYLHGL